MCFLRFVPEKDQKKFSKKTFNIFEKFIVGFYAARPIFEVEFDLFYLKNKKIYDNFSGLSGFLKSLKFSTSL